MYMLCTCTHMELYSDYSVYCMDNTICGEDIKVLDDGPGAHPTGEGDHLDM